MEDEEEDFQFWPGVAVLVTIVVKENSGFWKDYESSYDTKGQKCFLLSLFGLNMHQSVQPLL